jgi:tetratricopeptide (TPR) repeat protein
MEKIKMKNRGTRTHFVPLCLCAFLIICQLSTIYGAEDGGYEGAFMNWGAGARSLGMAKVFTGIADDSSAVYWNPAGLVQLDKTETTILYASLWEGINYNFLSFAYPTVTSGVFGVNIVMLNAGGAERRDIENNLLEGKINMTKLGVGLGYAYPIFRFISFGIKVNYIGRWFDNENTGFIGIDLSIFTRYEDLTVGVVLQNAVYEKFGDTEDELPKIIKLGIGYKAMEVILFGGEIEVRKTQVGTYATSWRIGVESNVINPFIVRGGINATEYTLGAGFNYNKRVRIDYSAGLHQELGLSHRASLSVMIGESIKEEKLKKAKEAYERAIKRIEEGKIEEAIKELREVMKYDPYNKFAYEVYKRLTKE